MVLIDDDAKSAEAGWYKSHEEEIATKTIDVAIPIFTAFFESFLPYNSLTISVTRKVEANRILPRVICIPKARTSISTSMFAAIVAMQV